MRLAFDGIAGLIGMVETMHGNIAGQFGIRGSPSVEGKTRGKRLVYRSLRGPPRRDQLDWAPESMWHSPIRDTTPQANRFLCGEFERDNG
jgi:hypothetical protein